MDNDKLQNIAGEIRRKILKMIAKAGGGHITPAFSIVEILTVLYFEILRVSKNNFTDENRDRFILSKGHGCAALYSTLAQAGFIPESMLDTFCQPESHLGGHPDFQAVPGIEATTGALGHGFPFAIGMALAGKMDKKPYRVFTILGDGECQEGSVWEAAQFAAHHKLDNLVAILDYNKYQAMGKIENILDLEPVRQKWDAFNWAVEEVDGHDISALQKIFHSLPFKQDKPSMIIAHTVKGKGVSYMEDEAIWHYRLPNEKEMAIAKQELGIKD